jgi:peroxiredoxin/outer membrane lipoprotein-sorting protein
MARSKIAATIPWLALVLLPAAGPKIPADGSALLRRVAQVYAGAHRFHLAGVIHARLKTPTGADTSSATFVAASGGHGRLRDQLDVSGAGMTRVSDGSKSWIYDGRHRQYVERAQPMLTPDAMDSLQMGEMGGIMGALLNSYIRIAEGADSVTVLRSETQRLDGRARLCDVVRARYAGSGERTMVRTFWIERARGVVLQQQTTLRMTSEQGPLTRVETLTFRRISLDQPVPDSLFVFRPPAGATRVERLAGLESEQNDLTGQAAADFSLTDLEGQRHRLSEQRGKVVMLDFWATWCGPCRIQMPAVERIYQEFKNKGLVVFTVNQRETADRAKAYIQKYSYTSTTLLDSQGEVGRQYGVRGIPTLVIVGRDGTIVAHWVGVHPESMLREGLKRAGIE